MTAQAPSLTKPQKQALSWLLEHGGDGTFTRNNAQFLAAGEIAPHTRGTFNRLRDLYLVEIYDKRRMRLTPMGRTLAECWAGGKS